MSAPPFNLAVVEASTEAAITAGHRIFQVFRFAETDLEHVKLLLSWLQPPEGASVLDAGCGIGEVARLMHEMRPDLGFALVNLSAKQLTMCPTGLKFTWHQEDCHQMGYRDGSFDAAMYSSTLCQLDTLPALLEAHRVLKPGGTLLINDMVRVGGNAAEMEQLLACRVLPAGRLLGMLESAGFEIEAAEKPDASCDHFRELLRTDGLEHLADPLRPILIRARK